jgi:AraC-like DNA-binding protein
MFGIDFKPGAFSHFYSCDPLSSFSRRVIEFDRKNFPDIRKSLQNFLPFINRFYLDRLTRPANSILNIASDISGRAAGISVESLTKKYCITERSLERLFRQQLGLSPKEFIKLHRFKKALHMLERRVHESLAEIAWDSGYYDHAHMCNDFRYYTGKSPTDFILSDFSKTLSVQPM